MNRSVKWLSLVMIVVLLAGLLAACGATEEPKPEATAAPEATKAPEATIEEEPEKPEGGVPEPTTIDVFHFYSEGAGLQPQLMEQTARFEEENPGWKVNWTWGGSEAMQKLRARINAGDPPDIAMQNDGNISVMAREGVAQPLDGWLDGDNYEGDATWKDTFYEGVLDHGYIEDAANGAHYYGIPQGVHFSGIFYNKGMFEEGGYELPTTFDEMFALCEKIQGEEDVPCFSADNFPNYQARPLLYIMRRLLGNDVVYNTAMNKAGTSWVDTPGFLEAAKIGQEMTTEYYVPGWQGNQWPTGQVDWANWGEAMIFMPSWLPSELLDTKSEDFEMDIFPVPAIDGGYEDQTEYEIKFNGWFVPEGAKNADAAIHFIKYLTGQQVQTEQAVEGTIASGVQGVPIPDVLKSFEPTLDGGTPIRFAGGLDADAAEWQAKAFFPLVDLLLFGDITPEEFIDQLQTAHTDFYGSLPTEEEPEAIPEGEVPEPATIDVFHFYSEGAGLQPQLVEQTARFEEENPGWKVNWTWGGSEAMQKLRARINAGDPPDIAMQNDGNISVMAREGVAVPLDDWLDSANYEADATWGDTFYEGVLHHGFIEDAAAGAHYYGIPQGVHFSGIFYNKGMFEEGGYELPTTFDEMFALCDKIQSEEGVPCFSADNFPNYQARPLLYIMRRLAGNDLVYDTAMNKEGTSWVDTPEFLEAAKIGQEMTTEYYVPGWQGNQWPTGQVDWANWGEAMIFMPSWLPSELLDTKSEDFEMDIFPVPAIDGGYEDQTEYEIKFNGWFVPDGAKNADAAIYFIKYLTGQQVQTEQAVEGTIASGIQGVPIPDVLKSFEPVLDGGTPIRFAGGLDADAAEWQAKVFFPLVDLLLFDEITPEEFIDQLQTAHDEFYQ